MVETEDRNKGLNILELDLQKNQPVELRTAYYSLKNHQFNQRSQSTKAIFYRSACRYRQNFSIFNAHKLY
jgi:hypothetical protein